jgi:6-phosphogluconate dehydrogenase
MSQDSLPHSDLGMFGLGVMGDNFARNIASHGFSVSVHDRSRERADQVVADAATEGVTLHGFADLERFVGSLRRPRRIVLLIKAGQPVDDTIAKLRPLLEPGDMIVDGGNSHPDETERRDAELAPTGLHFVGMGVSGGEEGARHGPSLMPGGHRDAYAALAPILEAVAARVEDEPCVTHVGPGAAGHFVKTVHNGIEYADMQLIAETVDVLRTAAGMKPEAIADVFERWDQGAMQSYLTEITARILRTRDPETGAPIVDVILDRAGQKGTGRWTCELALRAGVPAPSIQAAVVARGLSALKDERVAAAERIAGPSEMPPAPERLVEDAHDALYASKVCAYAQGLALIRTVSDEKGWGVDLAEVARIWRGGCIIRARLLDRIRAAWSKGAGEPVANLLLDPELRAAIARGQAAWRRFVQYATLAGVPLPATTASLAYYDSYRRATLPQNLTQAQRDLFGAHTFERVDRPRGEMFHHDWSTDEER